MENGSYQIYGDKLILRTRNRLCDTVDELITSGLFLDLLAKYVRFLFRQRSRLLRVFYNEEKVTPEELKVMQKTLLLLSKLPANQVSKIIPESKTSENWYNISIAQAMYSKARNTSRMVSNTGLCSETKFLILSQRFLKKFFILHLREVLW